MSRAVLLTGGNLGDVAANIAAVREVIAGRIGPVGMQSSVFSSPAWGFEAKEDFLNQVLVVETELNPEELLTAVQEIETGFGRERRRSHAEGYASRSMDIDILYYDDIVIDTPSLSVPHPLIAFRDFALRPLAQVMPDYRDPRTGETVLEMFLKINKQ